MKIATSFCSCLSAALLMVLSSSGIAVAACSEVVSGFNTDSCYGFDALDAENSSGYNSAFGYLALYSNTAGSANTAVGVEALYSNAGSGGLFGDNNTAIGDEALFSNTIGSGNTATGQAALYYNGTGAETDVTGEGEYNTADGADALQYNTTGSNNTAIGVSALGQNSSGGNNIGIGYQAGIGISTGSNNIEIGGYGPPGDSDTIRIGWLGTQTATFVAGIFGEKVGKKHCTVLVDSFGKLGCGSSKEVDASILLNQFQRQAAQMAELKDTMRRQAAELMASQERERAMRTAFEERLSRLEQLMASKDGSRNVAAAFDR